MQKKSDNIRALYSSITITRIVKIMTKPKIKIAVIGVGYLGAFHAQKYAKLPQAELVAVCDIDHSRCQEVALEHQVEATTDYRTLVDKVDAVSIAVPTMLHYELASFFLNHGIHVLLEKPITTTLEEADLLIACAHQNKVILQVGHLERFNNAILALDSVLDNPRFIESTRLAPFRLRGTDVDVVLDLMIHDIDIILSIVKAEIHTISATGAPVLSSGIDIANARIEFNNGCVANVTASRTSLKIERRIHIFQPDSYLRLDLDHKNLSIHRKGKNEMYPGIPEITREKQTFIKGDALQYQIEAFLNSIIENKPAVVSGEDARRALATAIEITNIVQRTNERYPITT